MATRGFGGRDASVAPVARALEIEGGGAAAVVDGGWSDILIFLCGVGEGGFFTIDFQFD